MSRRDLVKLLKAKGFKHIRTKGSHEVYSDGERNIVLPTRPDDRVLRCVEQQIDKRGPFYRAEQKHRRRE